MMNPPARPPALQALIEEMQSVYFQTPNVGDVVSRDMVLKWADELSRLLASVSPPEEQIAAANAILNPPHWLQAFESCAGCITKSHCAKARRCLAECIPADLLASVTLPQEEQKTAEDYFQEASKMSGCSWRCFHTANPGMLFCSTCRRIAQALADAYNHASVVPPERGEQEKG